MNKQPVRIVIGLKVQLTSPGMLGRKFDFKSGSSFLTQAWFYPGELNGQGVLAGKPRDQWSFCTNTGTDLPLFLDFKDIREVVIPNDPETVKVFEDAPFHVQKMQTQNIGIRIE